MAEAALIPQLTKDPTPRQAKLAEIILKGGFDTKVEALLEAEYSPSTARAMARRTLNAVGFQRALAAATKRESDKARGIKELRDVALANGPEDVRSLEPQARLGFALQATKTLAECPVEEESNTDGAIERLHRKIARAFELGRRWERTRAKAASNSTFSPTHNLAESVEAE